MSADDAPLRQPIPLARSILWNPATAGARGGRPGSIPFPIFVAQSAVAAIHEHLATAPPHPGQGLLGFLVGDLCECPETNVAYLVIDAALRLSLPIYGDRTIDVVTRIWDRIEVQVEEAKGHLIGWYHSHPPLPLSMSAHDTETHEHYFAEPWQIALVLGTGTDGNPAAGFFRAGTDEAWPTTLLPFYELLSEESFRPGGKKRSFVTWKNYRAYNPLADRPLRTQPKPAPPALPEAGAEVLSAPEPAPAPEPEPEPQAEAEAPAEPPPPPKAPQPKSDELVFLTAAEDFASAPSPRASRPTPRPARHPPPPPPPPPPPRPPQPSPPPRKPSPKPPPAALPPPPEPGDVFEDPLQEPMEPVLEPVEEEPTPLRAPPARRPARKRRRRRWVAVFGLLLIGGGGGFYVWLNGGLPNMPSLPRLPTLPRLSSLPFFKRQAAAPPRRTAAPHSAPSLPSPSAKRQPATQPPANPPAPAPVAAPHPLLTHLDQVADSLAQAVRTFGDRAALFDRRQLACDALARGLLAVEDRWLSYSRARRASAGLDPTHTARDQTLYAGVDSVERRFEKSGCQRP